MTGFVWLIIIVALGVIVGNIMLLKHSASMSMKNLKQDPIENAKRQLAAKKREASEASEKEDTADKS